MEIVEVEITGQAITARYGTLNAGDILRTDREFADHLVNDCGAAKYVVAKSKKPAAPDSKAKAKVTKTKAAPPPVDAAASTGVCTDLPAADPVDAPS
jgi:hypothetical protein